MSQPEGSSSTTSVTSSNILSLVEAVDKAQAGDHAAFKKLYEHYKIPLWRRLFYLVENQESAYDLFQETFLRVWKNLPEKPSEVPFESWLYCIARNLAIDYLRHAKQLTFLPLPESESDAGYEERVCETIGLQQALECMSPQYRVCLLLQDVWGYSQREIAVLLAISEKSVSSNVSRGHKQLRTAYQSVTNGFQTQRTGGQI